MDILASKEKEMWLAIFKLKGLQFPNGDKVEILDIVGKEKQYIIIKDYCAVLDRNNGEYFCLYDTKKKTVYATLISSKDENFSSKITSCIEDLSR